MTVRAKFKCVSNASGQLRLEAVVGGSPENDEFFKWTPGGSVSLYTVNDKAASEFEVGAEYFADFTRA